MPKVVKKFPAHLANRGGAGSSAKLFPYFDGKIRAFSEEDMEGASPKSFEQKLRNAAKHLGVKATIRNDKESGTLYLQGGPPEEAPEETEE